LASQFASGNTAKQYLAVVRGRPAFERESIDAPIAADLDFPIQCRMRVHECGQPARTELEVLWRGADRSLVRARPQSGRQHQIRVHLAHLGHPLLGDKLYQNQGQAYLDLIADGLGEEQLRQLGHVRCALHAESLKIRHPVSGEMLLLSAPLPQDLEQLLHNP
jgi:23S rRNA pseudouridine1911/1915/1917 synthase